jgi:hypothetical protein
MPSQSIYTALRFSCAEKQQGNIRQYIFRSFAILSVND